MRSGAECIDRCAKRARESVASMRGETLAAQANALKKAGFATHVRNMNVARADLRT